jgi:hypothetical protein
MELSNGALLHDPATRTEPADPVVTLTRPQLLAMLGGAGRTASNSKEIPAFSPAGPRSPTNPTLPSRRRPLTACPWFVPDRRRQTDPPRAPEAAMTDGPPNLAVLHVPPEPPPPADPGGSPALSGRRRRCTRPPAAPSRRTDFSRRGEDVAHRRDSGHVGRPHHRVGGRHPVCSADWPVCRARVHRRTRRRCRRQANSDPRAALGPSTPGWLPRWRCAS